MLKNMSGTKSKQNIPTIKDGNKSYITNSEKAEAFACNIAKNSSNLNFETAFLENKKNMKIETTPDPALEFHPINDRFELHKIQSAIPQCKTNSSPGEDEYAMRCWSIYQNLASSSYKPCSIWLGKWHFAKKLESFDCSTNQKTNEGPIFTRFLQTNFPHKCYAQNQWEINSNKAKLVYGQIFRINQVLERIEDV